MSDPRQQTTEVNKPPQSRKDVRANPHRPEYYVPRETLILASLFERLDKLSLKPTGPRLRPRVGFELST
jgi:hypothetical protein